MTDHIISMVVNDQLGMLSRITSIFKRKMLDIKTLTIIREEEDSKPRITIKAFGDLQDADLACKFLSNNIDVISIKLHSPEETVERELLLIKSAVDNTTQQKLNDLSQNFKFRTLRMNDAELVMEFIGSSLEVKLFLEETKDLNPIKTSRTAIIL